ncbi:alpha/beta hydrolase fold-domain-containing protein [Thelonectria olida]|uniref:Alpha/beta hydrolase fold-domain-containing protein n=1 Tax=Thelonectria olida TaxID=1576542 RepID=A0A9P8VNR3_9HYPO|nr:alpha/beta hydrolase fold-domain-containing protein [Thelonectria olida]
MSISQSWLEKEIGRRPVLKGTAEEIRDKFAELGKNLAPLYSPPSDAVIVETGSFQGIAYRIYTPRNTREDAPEKPPIGVYFHAGGFVVGNLDSDDLFCRAIAENTQVILVSVDYKLAPEHKAPAHLEDAIKIAEWVYHDAAFDRADRTKLFTMGTSAGGALALEVARKAGLDQSTIPKNAVKGVVVFSPVVFHPANSPVQVNVNDTPIIDREALLQCFELCGAQPDNADYFIGLDHDSHSLLPPAYIVTCGFDPLRDDGRVLAESMESRGLQVKRDHYEPLPHCFWMVPTLPESKTFTANAFQGIKWVLSKIP